jgi:hypothetical protein
MYLKYRGRLVADIPEDCIDLTRTKLDQSRSDLLENRYVCVNGLVGCMNVLSLLKTIEQVRQHCKQYIDPKVGRNMKAALWRVRGALFEWHRYFEPNTSN